MHARLKLALTLSGLLREIILAQRTLARLNRQIQEAKRLRDLLQAREVRL